MNKRMYNLEINNQVFEIAYTDDQMRSFVNQFKRYIELETGKTDNAVGTHTESVDDAPDDQGHTGFKGNLK